MASNTTSSGGGGIGFAGLLTIAFIVLKLTHVINWSWVWVLSPLWISFGLVVLALVLVGIGFLIYLGVKSIRENPRSVAARRKRQIAKRERAHAEMLAQQERRRLSIR